ncbi:hypothetical protein EAI_10521 [Harpegnathos saltator]|uniref:Uncharacterized protein n=1 Tax=Harpegnathos saltator TaxID=610380 RepID=E2BF30_HARSA|nr:hypothetical protein EAI_10521 [Harpegnathos saltator]
MLPVVHVTGGPPSSRRRRRATFPLGTAASYVPGVTGDARDTGAGKIGGSTSTAKMMTMALTVLLVLVPAAYPDKISIGRQGHPPLKQTRRSPNAINSTTLPDKGDRTVPVAFPSCHALHTAEEFASRCQGPADSKAKSNFRASEKTKELVADELLHPASRNPSSSLLLIVIMARHQIAPAESTSQRGNAA